MSKRNGKPSADTGDVDLTLYDRLPMTSSARSPHKETPAWPAPLTDPVDPTDPDQSPKTSPQATTSSSPDSDSTSSSSD